MCVNVPSFIVKVEKALETPFEAQQFWPITLQSYRVVCKQKNKTKPKHLELKCIFNKCADTKIAAVQVEVARANCK